MILAPFLPHDVRHFVHKRIIRGVTGFVSSGLNPVAGLGSFLAPAPARNVQPRSQTARPSVRSAAGRQLATNVKFGGIGTSLSRRRISAPASVSGPCPGLTSVVGPDGTCIDLLALPPGGRPALTPQMGAAPVGNATMGRFGAALVPGSRIIDRAVCLRGMVLGNDGLCYNSKGFRNSDRMWPRGRRPLLTGGDMRAISIASRAATRLTNTAVRLQKIGLIKKPVVRKRPKKKE